MNIDWNKVGNLIQKGVTKGTEVMEKKQKEIVVTYKKVLAKKTDNEILRIYNYGNLSEVQRRLVEEEKNKRGI